MAKAYPSSLGEQFKLPLQLRLKAILQQRNGSLIVLLLDSELSCSRLPRLQRWGDRKLFQDAPLALDAVCELVWRSLDILDELIKKVVVA